MDPAFHAEGLFGRARSVMALCLLGNDGILAAGCEGTLIELGPSGDFRDSFTPTKLPETTQTAGWAIQKLLPLESGHVFVVGRFGGFGGVDRPSAARILTSLSMIGAGTGPDRLRTRVPSVLGIRYRVEAARSLVGSDWESIWSIDGSGDWLDIDLPLEPDPAGARFLRLRAE